MKELRDALCSAYNHETFDQMLRISLEKVRAHLADSGSLRTIVFNVIEVAIREGWHTDLIRAASSDNPGNPALRRFCEKHPELIAHGEGSTVPPGPGSEAKKPAGQSNVEMLDSIRARIRQHEANLAALEQESRGLVERIEFENFTLRSAKRTFPASYLNHKQEQIVIIKRGLAEVRLKQVREELALADAKRSLARAESDERRPPP